jgi:hypothetical protein
MTYLPKAQEQMNGDLLVPEATKLFLHRMVQDLQARLERDRAASDLDRQALATLQAALGPCYEPLPSVREMLDLPDPQVERLGCNLLKFNLPR